MNAAACDGALKCTFARTVPSAATVARRSYATTFCNAIRFGAEEER